MTWAISSSTGSSALKFGAAGVAFAAGFCGEQAHSRAAQAAAVKRPLKTRTPRLDVEDAYFAKLGPVRLRTVSGAVTAGYSRDHRLSADEISELAEGLRGKAALGRSDVLNRLFDYLVGVSAKGTTPKEFEGV